MKEKIGPADIAGVPPLGAQASRLPLGAQASRLPLGAQASRLPPAERPVLSFVFPALAALGLADSAYLAVLHFVGEPPPCGVYRGCADVNFSPHAEIYGVPVAALGALLYAALLGVSLVRWRAQGDLYAGSTLLLQGLTLSGAVFMAYLTGIELFVIHAVCYWCLALALITFTLLALITRDVWAFQPRMSAVKAPQ